MGMGAPPVLGTLRRSLAWDLCLSKDGFPTGLCVSSAQGHLG